MLLQQLLGGISIGFIYAIVAVGYSLVFGVLGIMNMAHASTFTLGAHFILMFITMNFGVIPGFIASLILTGIINMCYDSFILSPLRSRPGRNRNHCTDYGDWFQLYFTESLSGYLGKREKGFPEHF